jgi:RND family efflux transporter MFP subunit
LIKIIARSMVSVVAVWLLQACAEDAPPVEQKGPTVVEVRTVTVQPGSWRRNFKAYGLVRPVEEYQIGVEVSATVKEVLFREGQNIEVGDLLLRLDAKKLRLRLEGARASVEEARANHDQAKSTHERNQSIYKTGVISEQTYLQSDANLKKSQANLRRAISSYDIASEEFDDAELKSPVSGVVTLRDIEQGQSVSPMDNLGVIRVTGALRVETFVSQKDINLVRVGMVASITSPGVPGQAFGGRVDQVASSAETNTGNFEVGVVVEDGGTLLRDGMSAMVEFQSKPQEGMLAVPRAALIDRGRRLIVYRVEDGAAQAVEPLLGVGDSKLMPVYSGLTAGDEIIVSNLRLISSGQQIRRINEQPEG